VCVDKGEGITACMCRSVDVTLWLLEHAGSAIPYAVETSGKGGQEGKKDKSQRYSGKKRVS